MPCSTPKPVSRASLPSGQRALRSHVARTRHRCPESSAGASRRFPKRLVRAARRTHETSRAGLDPGVAARPPVRQKQGTGPAASMGTGEEQRRAPRVRLRPDASARVPLRGAPAADEVQASAAGDRSRYRSRIRGKAGAAAWLPVFHAKRRGTLLRLAGGLSRRLRRRRVPRGFPNSRFEIDLAGARVLVFGSS
jgi:hypothetical protein